MLRKMISHKTSRSSRTEADLTDCQEDADICFHHNGLAPPFLNAVLFINSFSQHSGSGRWFISDLSSGLGSKYLGIPLAIRWDTLLRV